MKRFYVLLCMVCASSVFTGCGGGNSSQGSSSIASVTPAVSHFSVGGPTTASVGTAIEITVTALDDQNNPVSGFSGTVHFASTDTRAALPANSTLTNGTGTFSATLETAGPQTVTATDTANGAISGTSSAIDVVTAGIAGFTVTGSMSVPRESHTATLLNDGSVLVTGGMHWMVPSCRRCGYTLSALASAEVYDPVTAQFALTASMGIERVFHSATLLSGGKVLVAGGDNRIGTTYATTELYDPNTGQFSPSGTMLAERSGHTATLLANGTVLIAGGAGPGAGTTAELYDPTTGMFTMTGSMSFSRFFHTATLLGDGKVLIAGGVGGGATAELYDPATGRFSLAGSMSEPRSSHCASLLANGSVLVTGGAAANGTTASAELFDPATATFSPTGSMISPRENHTAVPLVDGTVLVAGGDTGFTDGDLSSAEVFDPAAGRFTLAGNMVTARDSHSATVLGSGTVLIAGGFDGNAGLQSLAEAELFP
jgi:hypothetical protein